MKLDKLGNIKQGIVNTGKKIGTATNDGLKTAGQKIGSVATAVATTTKEVTGNTIQKAHNLRQDSLYKKYNPISPDEYKDSAFNLPNLIVITEEGKRKDIAVCEGAIGWLSNTAGVETLHLYNRFLPSCGLRFIPDAASDTAYYVNPHDRSTFISVDYIMSYTNNAKNAELSNIAFCLGAKSYRIETRQSRKVIQDVKAKTKNKLKENAIDGEVSTSNKEFASTSVLSQGSFRETHAPYRPELVWFAKDPLINELVTNIVDEHASIETKDIQISGSSCSTMSVNVATKIEVSLQELKVKSSFELRKSAEQENNYDLVLHLEF